MGKLLESINDNKGKILKTTLIVGGAVLVLGLVTKMFRSSEDEELEISEEGFETPSEETPTV
jgi:hypothetical protein